MTSFREWQGEYASRGIPTFPIGPNKKPMVSRYNRFGLPASAAIAKKFPDAPGIGFMAGKRNSITIGDVDEVGEKPLQRFIDRHGDTPVIVRTASGKHHCWYRHNGERRVIRPEPGIEVDILGGGIAIAPQSHASSGQYQFVAGGLDDLDRLPVMKDVPTKALTGVSESLISPIADNAEIAPEGARDNTLWRACMKALADDRIETFEAVIAFANDFNRTTCSPPLSDEGVMHAAMSAWKYEQEGRNWFGKPAARITEHQITPLMADAQVGMLYLWARARFKPNAEFWLADGLAARFGWTLHTFQRTRRRAVECGLFKRIRGATTGNPALYVFGNGQVSFAKSNTLFST